MRELDLAALTAQSLARIRERTPLVHNITNFVVMNDTANVLLALGASPVMAHAIEEVREMVAHAGALVLNIGTLEESWIEAMLAAGEEANVRGIPVVLDPVGAGATRFRTAATERIRAAVRVAVVRGNGAELATIAGMEARIRGVDAVSSGDPVSAARMAATRFGGAAVVSGPVDTWPTPPAWPRCTTAIRSWAASPARAAWPRLSSEGSWRSSPTRSWPGPRR
jgi:hydroxyethylthiazole kinase